VGNLHHAAGFACFECIRVCAHRLRRDTPLVSTEVRRSLSRPPSPRSRQLFPHPGCA
jgi:hypothetical protein